MRALIGRELTQRLRHNSVFTLLALNGLGLALLALAAQSAIGSFSPWTAPAIGAAAAPQPTSLAGILATWRSAVLFAVLTFWLLSLVGAIVPGITAATFSGEKADGTLDALLLSGISSWGITLAKLIAAVIHAGLIALSCAPAFALVWLLGGVPLVTLGATFGLILAHLLLLASFSLVVSALASRTSTAIIVSYSVGLLASVLPTVAVAALGFLGLVQPGRLISPLSPLAASLASNPDFLAALLRATGAPGGLIPPRVARVVAGYSFDIPIWVMALVLDLVLTIVFIATASLAIEPLHRFKTTRLRRQARVLRAEMA